MDIDFGLFLSHSLNTSALRVIRLAMKKNFEDRIRNGLPEIFPRLWRYCYVLTGSRDTADDLAQATCVRAIEKSSLLQYDDKIDRWVFRIAQRVWLNELRSTAVRRGGGLVPVEDANLTSSAPSPESNIFAAEVLSGVMALPEAQRTAVLLVYVEGYTYREASEALDIPIGTVMSRLAGARVRLVSGLEYEKMKQA